VTGASQGFGMAIASAFLREGATVLICARSANDLTRTRRKLEKAAPGRVHAVTCDISRETQVESLAVEAQSRMGGVDILVVNAGVYGPKGGIEDVDWAAWVEAIGINLIGTVYTCRVFLPLLRRANRGKVLIVSGGGATKPLPNLSAYAASKAGIVRFGETLAGEVETLGIDVNMIAPGALNTRLLDEILEAGPEKVGESFYRDAVKQHESGGASVELGADLCVHLASGAGDGVTGRLISAQWDPWPRIETFKEELAGTDIYTLRRIVPKDRDKDWENQ
jgi:NAD(P)-dependent dehydrogenase (short-subunit alcohol dehydrogenase family)